MERIYAIVVDDILRMREDIKSRLGHEFTKNGWDIKWEEAADVIAGRRLINSSPRPYDLVVADIMFPRTDVPDLEEAYGLDLIHDARQRSVQTFILAISTGRDQFPDLMEDARLRGANHVLRRSEFSRDSRVHSPNAIFTKISGFLQDNGSVPVCKVTSDQHDPAVQGLLHEVGEATIARLHAGILQMVGRKADEIYVEFLSPGASGASVCKISAQVDKSHRTRHVLKLSRAHDFLAREAENGKIATDVLPAHLFVDHRPQHTMGPVNGWYALGGPLVDQATTFRAWLATGPADTAVRDVLEALFVEGLGAVFREGKTERSEPLAKFALPLHRQPYVLQAFADIKEVLVRPDGGNLSIRLADRLEKDLDAFITEQRLPGLPRRLPETATFECYHHGDLHGGNILISSTRHPRAQLIDPSHFAVGYWAMDPACLSADLLMRGIDAGAESMMFTGFGTWRALATKFASGRDDLQAVTTTKHTIAALEALSWIGDNLHRMFPVLHPGITQSEYRWEWHAALATQLLRTTYHADIPPPKHAVAFAAAHDQLVAAARAIRTLDRAQGRSQES